MSYEASYLDHMQNLLNATEKSDRTGTGTQSIFGHQIRHDLRDGFPLLTTKKMFTRGAIEELLWFIRGSTDVKELQAKKVNFWDDWTDEEGTIGPGYGKQFRNIEYISPIVPKLYDEEEWANVRLGDLPDPDFTSDSGATSIVVGQSVTLSDGEAIVLKELPANKDIPRIHWEIGYVASGYIATIKYAELSRGQGKDLFKRSVYGVGYYGEFDGASKFCEKLKNVWRSMLRRCYDKGHKSYSGYGAKGVHVDQEWHCFANFQRDASKIAGWCLKAEHWDEYQLDKDVLWASNRYSLRTCLWASKEEQNANTSTNGYFEATSPSGEKTIFTSIGEMARLHNTNVSAVHRCLKGSLKSHHDWTNFRYLDSPDGTVLRYRKIDQVKNVIAEIKQNPSSRRLIISLWNTHDIDRMELPPCHGNMIQFNAEPMTLNDRVEWANDRAISMDLSDSKKVPELLDEAGIPKYYLDLQMYQRSADWMLGVPVNAASYSLLLMMIAQVVNMEPREFIHSFGDTHLYLNHLEQAKEQLSREPYEMPRMLINKEITHIDDFTFNDFTLIDYDSHPAIKAEVSV